MTRAREQRVNYIQDVVLDYVIEINETKDYTEILGEKDGQVVTYRVYESGKYYTWNGSKR